MTKYIVNISKSIEGRFVVEAESLEDAYDAAISYETLFEVSDSGWDVIWNAEPLEGDAPAPLSEDARRKLGGEFLT
jgi:predicted RNase H-like HicB family nuclease